VTDGLRAVPPAVLLGLAGALKTGQLSPPYTSFSVRRCIECDEAIVAVIQALGTRLPAPADLALVLELAAAAAEGASLAKRTIELVWTGPEDSVAFSRDTAVVVSELFRGAERSVLVSGFALYQGRKVFRDLAANLDANPSLDVRLFLNVGRTGNDTSTEQVLLGAFADRIRTQEWPGERLPAVYYDPRALAPTPSDRAVLHAKCVVVDDARALVTSANLTTAAQEKNIEAGVLIQDAGFAMQLRHQFDALIDGRRLRRLPGVGGN
jgi:hypothetical protein